MTNINENLPTPEETKDGAQNAPDEKDVNTTPSPSPETPPGNNSNPKFKLNDESPSNTWENIVKPNLREIEEMRMKGATMKEIAKYLDIAESTFFRIKETQKDLDDVFKRAARRRHVVFNEKTWDVICNGSKKIIQEEKLDPTQQHNKNGDNQHERHNSSKQPASEKNTPRNNPGGNAQVQMRISQ